MDGLPEDHEGTCPICEKQAQRIQGPNPVLRIKCPRCGEFEVTLEFEEDFSNEPGFRDLRHLVSGACRELTLAGTNLPPLTLNIVRDSLLPMAPKTIRARLDALLWAVSRLAKYPGDICEIALERDYPLAYLKPDEDLGYYLKALSDMDLVLVRPVGDDNLGVQVAPAGWEWLEDRGGSRVASGVAFVAMSFSDVLRGVYEQAIAPAIQDTGYRPIRIDYVEHNDLIVDRIMAEIREARFVLADLTEGKSGVYFEAGYAMGLGIPVIWTGREKEEVHFDVQQFNRILWKDATELKERVVARILALVGRGPVG